MFRVSIILPFFAIAQTATMWPAEPVSPNATPEAKRILEYLSRLPGRYDHRIVSGRHLSAVETEPLADPDARPRSDLRNRVGMISLMYSSPARISGAPAALSRSHLNRILIDYWKAGGLVTLSFEGRNPWTGGDARDVNRGDLSELVTPGTEANAAWLKELDSVAKDLTELRDAGVVVLWRPFPSVNGDWFWWGQREPEAFQKDKFVDLWRHMFEYFTQVKHLNNLLWVYSADSSVHRRMSVTAYFPGQEYCDIVGMDCYSSDIIWDGYNNMVRLGKPFGATAVGPSKGTPDMLDVDRLMARVRFWYPLTTYFVASADGFAADSLDGPGLSKDPWVISREDLAWKITTRRRWQQNAKLAINRVELLTKHPVCWKRLDVRIDLSATFETPFDAAQIQVDAHVATPSGRIMEVPAFFDQPFERQVWGGGHYSEEAMVEAGPPEWRVRFMPGQAGKYSVTIRARDGSGSVQSPPLTFSAETAPGPGYIRVSRKDPHYFEFDDGEPFFAIGMNIAEHPLSEYYRYILRLSQNGGNFSRLWIGSEYFGLELGRMGDYRLDNAWRLDQVMELSERLGIYQELCIDWVRHITSRGEPRRGFDPEDYAYSTSNGGPCAGMSDFFTLPEAPRLFKNRLRYIVARWGYSPNVMAWELWNEIDLIDPKARRVSAIVSWNEEMCRYLKSIDPWQHLTTNSLAGRSMGPALWSLTENEFAQRHGYSTPTPQNVLTSVDMAGNVIQWLEDVVNYGKPYLMAEFGLQRDRMDTRALCDLDREGVHMHDGMWAALAHGAAGTAQLWWWGQYVDPKNLYYHFQAIANFVKDLPWTKAGFTRLEALGVDENLRVLGLRGKPVSILWLQNKAHTWWNVVNGTPIPPIEATTVTLGGFPEGLYRVEYWDTYEGRISSSASVPATAAGLPLPVPRIETDIAVKILPVKKSGPN